MRGENDNDLVGDRCNGNGAVTIVSIDELIAGVAATRAYCRRRSATKADPHDRYELSSGRIRTEHGQFTGCRPVRRA
jgi:hypothetical protein